MQKCDMLLSIQEMYFQKLLHPLLANCEFSYKLYPADLQYPHPLPSAPPASLSKIFLLDDICERPSLLSVNLFDYTINFPFPTTCVGNHEQPITVLATEQLPYISFQLPHSPQHTPTGLQRFKLAFHAQISGRSKCLVNGVFMGSSLKINVKSLLINLFF